MTIKQTELTNRE